MNAIPPFPEVLIESPARMLGECCTGDQLPEEINPSARSKNPQYGANEI